MNEAKEKKPTLMSKFTLKRTDNMMKSRPRSGVAMTCCRLIASIYTSRIDLSPVLVLVAEGCLILGGSDRLLLPMIGYGLPSSNTSVVG